VELRREAAIWQIKGYLRAKTSRRFSDITDKSGKTVGFVGDVLRGGRRVARVKVTLEPPSVTSHITASEDMPKNVDVEPIVRDIERGLERYLKKLGQLPKK
jgi:hypothetical protein